MIDQIDLSMVDWARAQFALTAIYHWLFVPLTLGLSFLVAIMETIYVKTGNPEWKKITKFWMILFGINFAIGVATGIILEFQFGTNWSNYSWFVGDIFGAPLAIEGIMAFFLESTFIAIMFFGWNKVSKGFHLTASWLTAIGASLSALWILVANAWMQSPTGMEFNPDTARNEMVDFWEILFSPMAFNKFLHTISNGYVIGSIFVIGISSWFLLKKRHILMAKRSILVAAIFGLITSIFLVGTGDGSAYTVAQSQPMKLAAMEGLYEGEAGAGLVAFGILNPDKKPGDGEDAFLVKVQIPSLLSILGYRNTEAYVPGVEDIVNGGYKPWFEKIPVEEKEMTYSVAQKIEKGKLAISALRDYKTATRAGDSILAKISQKKLQENFNYFGYGYLNNPESVIPNIPLTFYSFHIMVFLGFYFILLFIVMLFFVNRTTLEKKRWLLWISLWTIPLAYIASQAGWVVAEVGRQPWVIQDLLPTVAAVSMIDTNSIRITFWIFAGLFTALLIAEVMIMVRQIKIGPKEGGSK
ncbi:MAG: cytochrome ubiquinol oxidase subunit I [Bacteroidales bacterium]|nr:cytochrome ubiquinol oxidase subunit I [Bacteroidota bacterium]MBL6950167.1 cytochrome ubiquinol oxidase subunit I [Bacteroidales bacterium]